MGQNRIIKLCPNAGQAETVIMRHIAKGMATNLARAYISFCIARVIVGVYDADAPDDGHMSTNMLIAASSARRTKL